MKAAGDIDAMNGGKEAGSRMETEIQGKWVLYTKHVLKSPMDIGVFAGQDEPKLRAMASEMGLDVAGPLEHAYWDMTAQDVPHILEIWLPVRGKPEMRSGDGLKRVVQIGID